MSHWLSGIPFCEGGEEVKSLKVHIARTARITTVFGCTIIYLMRERGLPNIFRRTAAL